MPARGTLPSAVALPCTEPTVGIGTLPACGRKSRQKSRQREMSSESNPSEPASSDSSEAQAAEGVGYGVHSEVGRLRTVLVHRPGLELRRLTPSNCADLLFDDVVWVRRAQEQHDAFVELVRGGVSGGLAPEALLARPLAQEAPRRELIERTITDLTVGRGAVDEARQLLYDAEPEWLAQHMIGGLAVHELPGLDIADRSLLARTAGTSDFVIAPLPNSMFTRDSSCWIYGGVSLNPMYYESRERESLNVATVLRNHPRFRDAGIRTWYPRRDDLIQDFGRASLEGGDVMPIGRGVVMIGLSERTTAQMIEVLASELFEAGAAHRVIVCQMEKDRSHMHLDTVLTLLDHDAVTVYPKVVDAIRAFSLYPRDDGRGVEVVAERSTLEALSDALGLAPGELRVVPTGGDSFQAGREQWDDGNNVVALRPGAVVAYAKNEQTNQLMREAGIELDAIEDSALGRGRGGGHCMTCPMRRDPL